MNTKRKQGTVTTNEKTTAKTSRQRLFDLIRKQIEEEERKNLEKMARAERFRKRLSF